MTIRYIFSLDDCRAVRNLDREKSPNILADPRKWYIIIPAVAIVVCLAGRVAGVPALEEAGGFFCFTSLVSIPIHIGYDEWRLRGWFQNNISTGRANESYSLEVNDEGMLIARPGQVETRVAWSAIRRFVQNEKATLVYLNQDNYFYFPTRAMAADQRAELDEQIARHLKGKRSC